MSTSNGYIENLAARVGDLRTTLDGRPNANGFLEMFDDFLAQHEFDLALHVVCDYLMEQDKGPDSPTIDRINSLHLSMAIVDDCIDQLRSKAMKT